MVVSRQNISFGRLTFRVLPTSLNSDLSLDLVHCNSDITRTQSNNLKIYAARISDLHIDCNARSDRKSEKPTSSCELPPQVSPQFQNSLLYFVQPLTSITRPNINIHVTAPNHQLDQDIINLEVGSSLTIADLKSYINAETSFDISRQLLYFNGRPVQEDSKTLEELNIKDGEMIALLISEEEISNQSQPPRRGGQNQSSGARDGGAGAMTSPAQIESMRQGCLRNPAQLAQIRQQQPDLADAVHDQQRFKDIFERLIGAERDRERERQNQMRLLNEDPFNVEAQRKIEEIIRQDRVMENLQHAYEHNPEG